METKRIYVILPAVVETANGAYVMEPGRQIAQACHVTSLLRHEDELTTTLKRGKGGKVEVVADHCSITTIVLAARNQSEVRHVAGLLIHAGIKPSYFLDTNPAVYGPSDVLTAMAVYAYPSAVFGILDYLPLWGSK
jgi:hypothetical protein